MPLDSLIILLHRYSVCLKPVSRSDRGKDKPNPAEWQKKPSSALLKILDHRQVCA